MDAVLVVAVALADSAAVDTASLAGAALVDAADAEESADAVETAAAVDADDATDAEPEVAPEPDALAHPVNIPVANAALIAIAIPRRFISVAFLIDVSFLIINILACIIRLHPEFDLKARKPPDKTVSGHWDTMRISQSSRFGRCNRGDGGRIVPAIITHHLFACEAYEKLASTIGDGPSVKDAFLLGNIGPDPLLCLKVFPDYVPYRKLGSLMHRSRPTELLAAFHKHFVGAEGAQADALRGFALGFLCHYLLDSTVHPLVYAQQRAICGIGIEGFEGRNMAGTVHALIETELDEYVLFKTLGVTVDTFVPHREILVCSGWALDAISTSMMDVVRGVYGIRIPALLFGSSVRLYRRAQLVLDAERDGLRSRYDYARIVGKHYPHVLALAHKPVRCTSTMFSNDDHVPWPHPFAPGAVMDASFDDLYRAAFEKAMLYVPRFAEPGFSRSDCEALTGNLTFSGKQAS